MLAVSRLARERANNHRGIVVWLTGLPGAGKTSLANEVEKRLFQRRLMVYVLDGDTMRGGLCQDLGFNAKDRSENVRRVGEVAALMADAGMICCCALISPYAADRATVRKRVDDRFFEVHVDASSATCARRDPKGLYGRHLRGQLSGLTGVDAPYEPPEAPELHLSTEQLSLTEAADLLEANILRWASLSGER